MKAETKKILDLSVKELQEKLHSRELSSCEVTEAYLCSIEENDPEINAYITVCENALTKDAISADALLSEGGASVLCGIPFALKDNIATKGIKTTCASRILADFVPMYSAGVANRITEQGGILLGKTNMDEFAMGSSNERSFFGAVKNPLDLKCSPGGSSGGSAAAVASRMAPWAVGTDTGGSSRQPASYCGLVSMKPTYGLVSRNGVIEYASSFDTVCPITRNVYDNAMVLGAMAGRDELDMTSIDTSEDYTRGIGLGVKGLRFGVIKDFQKYCAPEAAECINHASRILQSIGAEVHEVELPDMESVAYTYIVLSSAEASSNLSRYDGIKYGCSVAGDSYEEIMNNTRELGFGDEVKRRILMGGRVLSREGRDIYDSAKSFRSHICNCLNDVWNNFDMLLMPTTPGYPEILQDGHSRFTEISAKDGFSVISNITGAPAITVPYIIKGRLPLGISLMGRALSEKTLYKAAFALEGELSEREATV